MDIINLLSTTSSDLINFAVESIPTSLKGLEVVIGWLFDKLVYVWLAVIVFTLVLKTVVLPLDIYSRVKTKKQSLLMEKMREPMEKLQKQYANDKEMYNQKVMELQKANGYNPLAACLPMVISLVVFMVVFSAFSTYSQYANLQTYNDMVGAYNGVVEQFVKTDVTDENNQHFLSKEGDYYIIDYSRYDAFQETLENGVKLDATASEPEKNLKVIEFVHGYARQASAKNYRDNRYKNRFIWIGNVWYPDSMFYKEVPDFSKFKTAIARAATVADDYKESFEEVTYNLHTADGGYGETKAPTEKYNGYFVLILLAIGLMFLQQFIMMRSQKAANELSSVDGSAAKTNKWMMIMMPIIYGIFSFMYSAAFSLYMIINTAYGLISTLIINKVVAVTFEKSEEKRLKKAAQKKAAPNRKRLK